MNEFDEKMQFYRQRKARNISLAVMGYFLAVVCLIGCTVLWASPIIGVLMLLVIIAASTGLIIYTKMSTPLEYSGQYSDDYSYDGYNYGPGNSNSNDPGYSTRDVSTEVSENAGEDGTSSSAGAAGAPGGGGAFGGAGGAGGSGKGAYADTRYYTKGRVSPAARQFKQIMEIYWVLVTVVYFIVSFFSGAWHITWLIWLIGTALDRAIRIIWETLRYDSFDNKR